MAVLIDNYAWFDQDLALREYCSEERVEAH